MRPPLTTHYLVPTLGGIRLDGAPTALRRTLAPHRAENHPTPGLHVRFARPQPSDGRLLRGRYKGVRWSAAIEERGPCTTVTFHSTVMTTFLSMRMVVLPWLKRRMVVRGGVPVLGTALQVGDVAVVLTGPPGSGKTRLGLSALEHGARFIGDNELAIDERGAVQTLFDEVELRFQTAYGAPVWKRLGRACRARLWLFRLIAAMTARRVTFNITATTEQLGIKAITPAANQLLTLVDVAGRTCADVDLETCITALMTYEREFDDHFGAIIALDASMLEQRFREVLPHCQLTQWSPAEGIEGLLSRVAGQRSSENAS